MGCGQEMLVLVLLTLSMVDGLRTASFLSRVRGPMKVLNPLRGALRSAAGGASASVVPSTYTTQKTQTHPSQNMDVGLKRLRRPLSRALVTTGLFFLVVLRKVRVGASAGVIGGTAPNIGSIRQTGLLWLALFTVSAMLHGAETAFTKISPFKIKEVVEEEGSNSPFAVLSNKDDSTRMLTTILLTTTSLSIYSTALFVGTVSRMFPQLSLGTVTAALTSITLLFGEILPKALAVSNPEVVVRRVASPINYLATVLQPITATVTFLSKLFLGLLGLELVDDKAVSEDMLRMMVVEAQRDPTTGIESGEGRMIEGVLDLQKQTVDKIMCPRIDMLALPTETSATELLRIAIREQFSRIPIYAGDIDNIQGIVIIRDLLNFIRLPEEGDAAGTALLPAAWERLTAKDLMVPTYYIPETMSTYSAMEELRRRSKHMAIVVDEYGGTAGVVTFEDILEEVVGEIYDESDTAEEVNDLQTISRDSNGAFTIAGNAELDDVAEALGMELDEEVVGETSTIGGLLSKQTGCIPELDARLVCGGYYFTVIGRNERRILSVTAQAAADLEDGWEGDWGDYKLTQESLEEQQGDGKSGKKEDGKGGGVAGVEGVDGLDVDVPEGTTLSFRDGEWVASSGNGNGNGIGNTSASASTNVK